MKRLIPVIIVFLVVVLSGCTGQDSSSETDGQIFERANPNLNGKMMDIELLPKDARAGEKITASLVVGNTGAENVNSETIEIKARARSLDDLLANIALMAMSEQKKTITFSSDYKEDIKPGMIKPLTHVFPTPLELKGRSLSGTYDVTVILSVNGQKVESKSMVLKLRSGKPRDGSNTLADTSSGTVATTPMVTGTVPATTVTATPTPTPTSTPEAVTVDQPTGFIRLSIIQGGSKFGEPTITINAGDTIQWKHFDNDDVLTLAEMDGKIPNQTVRARTNYVFNTTGTYRFQLFYSKMRIVPPVQVINVVLNTSQ